MSTTMRSELPATRWPLRRGILLSLFLAFCLVFALTETAILFGLPFTSFRGIWAEQEQEAMAALALRADTRRGMLERWARGVRANLIAQTADISVQEEVQTLLQTIAASNDGGAEGVRSRLREHFIFVEQLYPGEFDRIELLDAATGRSLVSTVPGDEGADLSQSAYFKEISNPLVEEVVMEEAHAADGLADLHFCRRIHAPGTLREGAPLAVLVFHNPMKNITADVLHQGIGRTGEIELVDQDSRLVAPLRYPLPDGRQAKPQEFIVVSQPGRLAAQGTETQLIARDYRGVEVVAATRHLRVTAELGWGVVVKMDRAEVLAPIFRSVSLQMAGVAGALLVCAAVMVLVVGYFVKPLAELNRAASRIEAGEFSVQVTPQGSRETWTVGRAFNAMAKRIEGWHAELTREVHKRTAELSRTNTALQESETRFRSLFENIHVATLLIDPENGAIVDANEAATTFYGWPKERFRSMFLTDIHTLTLPEIKARMAATLAEGRSYFHFRHRLADGTIKDVEVYSGPIQVGGKALLCSIIHDITQRKLDEENRARLEEQLQQAAKMEAVGRLAGGVAHDFNNMLSVILGYVDFLKEDFATDRGVMKSLMEIEKAANRSRDITRQLLGFSRKQVIAPQPVNINEAIATTQRNLGRLMGEDVEFVFRPGEDLWRILIDPSQVDQVLMNLAVNARDAMPTGGKFILETENRVLDAAYQQEHAEIAPGSYVLLTVSDTGCGMDRTTLNHIFEPFFTTKEVGKGTGLGLATVFGIVQQNKGFINVYSEPGQGTTFRLYLPRLAEDGVALQRADAEEVVARGTGTILLVEDEDQVRGMAARMLEGLGYGVAVAASPQEALNLCQSMPAAPDLLLTDVIMPGMSGRELCDRLTAQWPALRTLFMSGYTADLLAPHQVLAPGTHFLQKPFSSKELARRVREAMLQ